MGPIPVRTVVGYTFNYAGDLTNDPAQENMRVYLDNFFQAADSASRDNVLAGSLLKYRNRGRSRQTSNGTWDHSRLILLSIIKRSLTPWIGT